MLKNGNVANGDQLQNRLDLYDALIAIGWTVQICRVKTHTDQDGIRKGHITDKDRHGNAIADFWARQGARLDQVPDNTVDMNQWIDSTAWSIVEENATIDERCSDAEQEKIPKIRVIPVPNRS